MRSRARSAVVLLACVVALVAAYCTLEWRGGGPRAALERQGVVESRGGSAPALPLEALGSSLGRAGLERTAILADREGRRGDPEDLSAILRSLRGALESADVSEVEALINRAVASFDDVLAYVSRLSEPGLEQEERENVLMLIGLMLELHKATRGDGVAQADLEARFGRLYLQVLSDLGDYPREDSDAVLGMLAESRLLDDSFLEVLSGWLLHFKDSEPFAELVADLALGALPPRYDIVMDLVHHGEGGPVVAVAEKLAAKDPALSLELALLVAKELPKDSELWPRASRLVATLDEPEGAFDFLIGELETRGWSKLLPAADALEARGLHEHAIDRYMLAENPEERLWLVYAAMGDAGFMEHVLASDESLAARDTALLTLSRNRADAATGALLVEAVAGILRPPVQGGHDLPCSPEAVLWAVQNYWSKSAPDARGSRTFGELRRLLEELAQAPDSSEAVRSQALELRAKMAP